MNNADGIIARGMIDRTIEMVLSLEELDDVSALVEALSGS